MDKNQRRLVFAKPKKVKKQRLAELKGKIEDRATQESYDSLMQNVLLGDYMRTGIIGGLDMDITTPL